MLKKKVKKDYSYICQICECDVDLRGNKFTKWFKLIAYENPASNGYSSKSYAFCFDCWRKIAGKDWFPEEENKNEIIH